MDSSKFKIGDPHFMAYVGSPALYDIMGASQFRLLCTLGLRANHCLLDFGCGSLRGGSFFINYLNQGCYYGIEPNQWLIDDAISNQIGQEIIDIKKPKFSNNDDFNVGVFSRKFDFIIAHSIFSHTGIESVVKGLSSFSETIETNGLVAASFYEGSTDLPGDEWVYPEVVSCRRSSITSIANSVGLFGTPIPWYHPSLTWFIFSKNRSRLPDRQMKRYLHGAILTEREFYSSWKLQERSFDVLRRIIKRNLSPKIQKRIISIFRRARKS